MSMTSSHHQNHRIKHSVILGVIYRRGYCGTFIDSNKKGYGRTIISSDNSPAVFHLKQRQETRGVSYRSRCSRFARARRESIYRPTTEIIRAGATETVNGSVSFLDGNQHGRFEHRIDYKQRYKSRVKINGSCYMLRGIAGRPERSVARTRCIASAITRYSTWPLHYFS